MSSSLLAALVEVVGAEHVVVDPDVRAGYERDWTDRFGSPAAAVVRPGNDAEVAAALAVCAQHGAAVVPQGGNTSLVGGSVPRGGRLEVIVTTGRLRHLGDVDPVARQVEVGAGVPLAVVRAAAASTAGLDVGVDLAARDSATIGGMVATNAGGSRVARFGTMAAQVRGVRVATSTGTLLGSMSGLPKASAGFRPELLVVGSEGTLGIVTSVRLALVPVLARRSSALCAIDGLDRLGDLVVHLRACPDLDAAELILPGAYELAVAAVGTRPLDAPAAAYVLVELAGDAADDDVLSELLAGAPGVTDAVVAGTGTAAGTLRTLRDDLAVHINRQGKPLKLDVAVPVPAIGDLVARVERRITEHGDRYRPYLFGHLLEGNVHVNLVGGDPLHRDLTDAILRDVADLGGAISAEHGIGVAKAPWLGLVRSPADIAAARAVKAALDPAGVMNPGVLFA